MKDVKYIVAENLIALRKSKNLTQIDLAEQLSYSDNMVSRWERAEVTPSLETLQKISEFYNVPLESLIKENIISTTKQNQRVENIRKFSIVLLLLTAVWFIITAIYAYANTILNKDIWTLFILGVPLSCIVLLLFNGSWNKYIYRFVVLTIFIWTALTYFYLLFIEYNIFLIYIVGAPAQIALVVWAFIKPKG